MHTKKVPTIHAKGLFYLLLLLVALLSLSSLSLAGEFKVPAPVAGKAKPEEAKPAKSVPPAGGAAAAPAAPPAPTAPVLVAVDKINSGDTAWMLASTALVLLMTIPGLALFYGGLARKKNVLAT